jgi:hypothetical protein
MIELVVECLFPKEGSTTSIQERQEVVQKIKVEVNRTECPGSHRRDRVIWANARGYWEVQYVVSPSKRGLNH